MCDEDDGALVGAKGVEHLLARDGIEVVGRLVEQQHVRRRRDETGEGEASALTTGQCSGRLVELGAGEHESAEQPAQVLLAGIGREMPDVVPHRGVHVERVVLLCEVTDAKPVPRDDAAFPIGALDACQQLEQRGLSGAVEAQDDDPRALVDRQIHAGEDLEGAIHFGQALGEEWGFAARRRLRESDSGGAIGDRLLLEVVDHRIGAAEHLLGGGGLRRLRAELGSLRPQGRSLLLCVRALAATSRLVCGPLLEVFFPAEIVGIDLSAYGVEEPHLVHHVLEKLDVVGDDDEPALVLGEEVAQPVDRIGVEVVGRLVEQQRRRGLPATLGGGEQNPGELDAATLAAGKGAHLLLEDAVLQPQRGADPRGLAFGLVAASRGEFLLVPTEPANGFLLPFRIGVVGHTFLLDRHLRHQLVEATGGEYTVLRRLLHVALARILREIADLARRGDLTAVGLPLAGDDAHRGGLTGAIATDEPDAVPRLHTQRLAVHVQQGAHTCAYL